jgi:hypothetical protein
MTMAFAGAVPTRSSKIRSPEDDTYDKRPFYAALEIREVVVVNRDTRKPEIYRLAGALYVALQPDAEGWLRSEMMGIRFRAVDGPLRLSIEDPQHPPAHVEI